MIGDDDMTPVNVDLGIHMFGGLSGKCEISVIHHSPDDSPPDWWESVLSRLLSAWGLVRLFHEWWERFAQFTVGRAEVSNP